MAVGANRDYRTHPADQQVSGMTVFTTRMSEDGRIALPADVRRVIGLEHGGTAVMDVVDGEIHVRSVAKTMDRARALARHLLAGKDGASVEDFLADRRREAEREG